MTRRHLDTSRAILLAGIAAVVPVAASRADPPQPAAVGSPFIAPEGEFVLTRELRKSLHDGKEIVIRRSYAVRFSREASGFRLDGELLDVSVDAPESLRALAEMERRRPDTGMFPLRLDAQGFLLPSDPRPAAPAVRKAAAFVQSEVREMGLSPSAERQATAFAAAIERNPGYTRWPVDLFRPRAGTRHEERAINLPGNMRGTVTIEISARTQEHGDLLGSLTRTVVTDTGESRRTSIEKWTLVGAG